MAIGLLAPKHDENAKIMENESAEEGRKTKKFADKEKFFTEEYTVHKSWKLTGVDVRFSNRETRVDE